MIERLLSDEFPGEIGAYVYNSEYSYINREFEYINKFELRCLEQFNVCKSFYESLEIWEKDEVIKYWVKQYDSYFDEEEIIFSSKNINKFDLVTFYEVDPNDFLYFELESTDPYPIFYLNYYIRKFRFLLINFFLFEQHCNLEALQFANYSKPEFNPAEFLNLPELSLPVEIQIKTIKSKITQKTIVCFFHLLRDSKIRPKGSYSNNYYCQKMCDEFKLKFGPKLPKLFSYDDFNQVDVVKAQIFPTLDENIKSKMENYIILKGY